MPDIADFLPLRTETRQRIRARFDADVNAGLAPGDPRWLDTTEGGFYWDATQPAVLELERQWDALAVEFPAVVFLPYSYGPYLDLHGEVLNVPRKDASFATGVERFTGDVGTLIQTGAQVAVPGVGESEPITYVTTTAGVIDASGTIDLPIQAEAEGGDANAVPGAVQLPLTQVDGLTAITNPGSISGGADIEDDEAYKQRLLQTFVGVDGSGTVDDHVRWATGYPGIGFAAVFPEDPAPGYVRVVITDPFNDPVSTTLRDAYQQVVDPTTAQGVVSADTTLPTATTLPITGDLTQFVNVGYVVINDTTVVTYNGKSGTGVTNVIGPAGTLAAGSSVKQSGRGGGLAPVGQRVIVETPVLVTIDVMATVVMETGFSLDGTGGTTAVRAAIEAAIARYINNLRPGDDVVTNRVESLMFNIDGIYDTSGVQTRKGAGAFSTANVVVAPLEVPQLGVVTLTEA